MTTNKVKEMPHSKENEMIVLGCMLTSEYGLKLSAEELVNTDFYFSEHKTIFNTLKSAYENKKPTDIHLVCEDLKRQDKLKAIGGVDYITTLAQYAGTSAHIEEYIDSLKENSRQRHLLFLTQKIEKQLLENGDSSKIIIEIQEELNRIEKKNGFKDKHPIQFLNQFSNNFLLTDPPKKPMLIEYVNERGIPTGFLPKGIVAMIVGAGGIGKTHLLAQLAISVSTGTPWLETFTTTKHCGEGSKGNVFFGLGENQYDDIHRVLHKASKKLREHQPDILKDDPLVEASKRIAPYSFCGQQAAFIENGKPSLYFRKLKMQLIEKAPKAGWSLIIFDPVSRLMGADAETDNAAATQFISLLEELTIDLPGNPTVLFAHHVNKSAIKESGRQDQTAARGSSALTDGCRWQCNFSRKDDKIACLEMTKSNFTAILKSTELIKDEDGYLQKAGNKTNLTSFR